MSYGMRDGAMTRPSTSSSIIVSGHLGDKKMCPGFKKMSSVTSGRSLFGDSSSQFSIGDIICGDFLSESVRFFFSVWAVDQGLQINVNVTVKYKRCLKKK